MKNLSKSEMNAVVGGIGPKSSVAGGLGGISIKGYNCWPKQWKVSATLGDLDVLAQ